MEGKAYFFIGLLREVKVNYLNKIHYLMNIEGNIFPK